MYEEYGESMLIKKDKKIEKKKLKKTSEKICCEHNEYCEICVDFDSVAYQWMFTAGNDSSLLKLKNIYVLYAARNKIYVL